MRQEDLALAAAVALGTATIGTGALRIWARRRWWRMGGGAHIGGAHFGGGDTAAERISAGPVSPAATGEVVGAAVGVEAMVIAAGDGVQA